MNELAAALKVHIALNVRDVEASIAFYRKLFSLEPAKVRPGYAKFDVIFPPVNLSLNQVDSLGHPGALSHLGIQVPSSEDVLAVRRRLEVEGLSPRDERQTSCCYALQDKAWVNDPDGNAWEVFVVLKDNLPASNSNTCCSQNETLITIGN